MGLTCWTVACDKQLNRLMRYIHGSLSVRQFGYVGDPIKDIAITLYCDADFAGCPYTLRSTDGVHADIEGPNTRFPWAGGSKGQSAMAQSTPEAELSSLNSGMNEKGEPAIKIWDTLLGHFHRKVRTDWQLKINLQEDNTTAIQGVRNGKNPTMKTLERIFGILGHSNSVCFRILLVLQGQPAREFIVKF